ncbi:Elongation of very long chain fatty acids protein 2 [Anabarilius grahami]|uniref:Elongation of very long chain fatty acids protein n=1 Tax=Anabarilius grahami TaxID=495550 RepID=A0A3N0YXQ3_ANAGA|nr:Elongation of very long chain fatty acids protein 2 [Anabarilius grahami]
MLFLKRVFLRKTRSSSGEPLQDLGVGVRHSGGVDFLFSFSFFQLFSQLVWCAVESAEKNPSCFHRTVILMADDHLGVAVETPVPVPVPLPRSNPPQRVASGSGTGDLRITLISAVWSAGYRLQCQGLHEAGEADIRVAKVLWWYYFSKLIEFLDTVFIVLRKKNSQISFLHVYHHASMFNIWWCVLNWIPCGQSFFGPMLNSFIHILMYSYYGLSTIPSMHKYLWWKRYLTQAQLVQFVLTVTHTVSAWVVPCGFPLGCLKFQTFYMCTLVVLFVNFYMQTYKKRRLEGGRMAKVGELKNNHSNGLSSSLNGANSKQKLQ